MKSSSAILLALCLCFSNNASALSFSDFFGPRFNGVQTTRTALAPKNALDSIHRWNAIAINSSGLDHTQVTRGGLWVIRTRHGQIWVSAAYVLEQVHSFVG